MTTAYDADHPRSDANGHSVARARATGSDLPADVRGIDGLLGHLVNPTTAAADMPSDLVDRVFIASRSLLPATTPAPTRAMERAADVLARVGPTPRLRWARLAMAVAACVTVAAGTMVVFDTPRATPGSDSLAAFESAVPDASADEAMLVALLEGRDSSDTWVSDDAFNRSAFSRDVAPVLRSRDTDYVDVAVEMQAVFGAGIGLGL